MPRARADVRRQGPVKAELVREVTMRLVPLELREANALVAQWHRHHQPVQGHRFSIGLLNNRGELVGAAIMGRPVARRCDHRMTLEITRLVTNGATNACSALYSAAARAAKAMGYAKIQTYILASEHGTSLKASGWECEGPAGGGQWKHTDGKPRRSDQPTERKTRWAKMLHIAVEIPPVKAKVDDDLPLFDGKAP